MYKQNKKMTSKNSSIMWKMHKLVSNTTDVTKLDGLYETLRTELLESYDTKDLKDVPDQQVVRKNYSELRELIRKRSEQILKKKKKTIERRERLKENIPSDLTDLRKVDDGLRRAKPERNKENIYDPATSKQKEFLNSLHTGEYKTEKDIYGVLQNIVRKQDPKHSPPGERLDQIGSRDHIETLLHLLHDRRHPAQDDLRV